MSYAGPPAIAVAPMRISLAGGGTDLPSYSERFGGTVISLAIDRRVVVGVSPCPRDDLLEPHRESTRIGHAELMGADLAPAAVRRVGRGAPWLTCVSAAPPRSGLGGSGAFLVALLHALRVDEAPGPEALAEEASGIEMDDLGRGVGRQDHYIAALGGLRKLTFGRDGQTVAEPLRIGRKVAAYFAERLLLFHTGLSHDAATILSEQDRKTRGSDALTLSRLHAIHSLVEPMATAIDHDEPDEIGPILHEHWRHKVQLSDEVEVPRVAALYSLARASGADGGKLVGAGGGGFLLLSCREGRQAKLRAAMASMGITELPFGPAREGSVLRRPPPAARDLAAAGVERSRS